MQSRIWGRAKSNMSLSDSEQSQATAVIVHSVVPGRVKGYEEWLKGIASVAKTFPGHQGVNIFCPQPGGHQEYVAILHFDTNENLCNWLESDTRKEWIQRVSPLIQKPESVQVKTGLESWFKLPGQKTKASPPRYRQALVTWIGVYSLAILFHYTLGRFLVPLPIFLRQAISTGLIVFLLAYVVMPQLVRLFYKWLHP